MSAHPQSSGPRSNAYSKSKFTHWTAYDPFFAEACAALKRFDSRIPQSPKFPHVVVLRPQLAEFIHVCTREEVIAQLKRMRPAALQGLRAVFLLAGTRKQEQSWKSQLAFYGLYWRSCVFLCAHTFDLGYANRDALRDLYLDEVLVHEVAHHIDRGRKNSRHAKESFAHAFVQRQWAMHARWQKRKSWGER